MANARQGGTNGRISPSAAFAAVWLASPLSGCRPGDLPLRCPDGQDPAFASHGQLSCRDFGSGPSVGPDLPAGVSGAVGSTGLLAPPPTGTLEAVLASGSPAQSAAVTLTVIDCAGFQSVLVNESGRPSASATLWLPCTTAAGAIPYQLQPGGGFHSLHVWGRDSAGDISDQPALVAAVLGSHWFVQGNAFDCALVAGAVECWGDNTYGELGLGTSSTTPAAVPTIVPGLESGVDEIVGGAHTQGACALQGGQVFCWGINDLDEAGVGATAMCGTTPCVPTPLQPELDGLPLAGVTSLFAGSTQRCANIRDHSPVCWGQQGEGQLGNGATSGQALPVPVSLPEPATVVGSGTGETCFVTGQTQFECAGYDYDYPADAEKALLAPAGSSSIQTCAFGYACVPTPRPPAAVTQAALPDDVAFGLSMDCLRFGGAVFCWGSNTYGQLGNGTVADSTTEVSVQLTAAADLTVAGAHHACARLTTGEVACWGLNDLGQIGSAATEMCNGAVCAQAPVLVPGIGRIAGLATGRYQTCVALDSGIACWGSDQSNMLLGLGQDLCNGAPCSETPITVVPATLPR